MTRYLVGRVVVMVPTILVLSLALFVLMRLTPGSPLQPIAPNANPLSPEHIKQIVDIQLRSLRQRLADRKIDIELTEAARQLIAAEGFDPVYGARPLKRAIQKDIIQPLAMRLLRGDLKDGDQIRIDVRNGQIDFVRVGEAVAAGVGGV